MRLQEGLTQVQLAERMQSEQSVISRLESKSNTYGVQIQTLERIAKACNRDLKISFPPKSK